MQQASAPVPANPSLATSQSRLKRCRPAKSPRHAGETLAAYLFLAPYLIILGVFTVFAAVYGLYLSFYRVDIGFSTPEFIGIRNYQALWNQLFYQGGVGDFWISMINIVKFVVIVVPTQTIFALIMALLLNRVTFLKGIFRTIFYLPSVSRVAHLLVAVHAARVRQLWTLAAPHHWTKLVRKPCQRLTRDHDPEYLDDRSYLYDFLPGGLARCSNNSL